MICPYCGASVDLVSSTKVYQGRDFGMIWCCSNYPKCDSYVGAHPDLSPLGRLANKELRRWKLRVHDVFDPLWQAKMKRDGDSKKVARGKAYKWLAEQLAIEQKDCHVGMFDVDMCKLVVDICLPYIERLNRRKQ